MFIGADVWQQFIPISLFRSHTCSAMCVWGEVERYSYRSNELSAKSVLIHMASVTYWVENGENALDCDLVLMAHSRACVEVHGVLQLYTWETRHYLCGCMVPPNCNVLEVFSLKVMLYICIIASDGAFFFFLLLMFILNSTEKNKNKIRLEAYRDT